MSDREQVEQERTVSESSQNVSEQTYHELKTWPEYFAAILSGRKRFEIRKNDRNFKTGEDEAREQVPHPGDGSCDHCGAVPSVHIPTNLCDECRDGVKRAEAAEAKLSEVRSLFLEEACRIVCSHCRDGQTLSPIRDGKFIHDGNIYRVCGASALRTQFTKEVK